MPNRPDPEAGSALVEFIALVAIVLLPLFSLLVTFARVSAGTYAAVEAAREAARVFVSAPDEARGEVLARSAARSALEDFGIDADFQVRIACSASPCFTPEALVEAEVRLGIDLPFVPSFVGAVIPARVPVSATAYDTVEEFR